MTRRPMCLLCLLLILIVCLAEGMGVPLMQGNPLPRTLREWVRQNPQAAIRGEVVRSADTEFSQSVYLKNAYLLYNSEEFPIDEIRIFLKEKASLRAGASLVVRGYLEEVEGPRNPGEFDSRQYYACRHIYYFMKKAVIEQTSADYDGLAHMLSKLRERFLRVLKTAAGEESGIFSAIVLGDKSMLDEPVKMRYQMGGIVHMLAISGLHISVLGMGLYQLLKYTGMGISPAAFFTLVIMLLYGMMTGGSVSTIRAVCMFLLSMGAKILGRIYDMLTALSLTAVLILLESPAYLLDSSFLLSFGAVLGVGVTAPLLERAFCVKSRAGKLLLSSGAVQLTTLPIVLYFFGEVSLAGIFVNLAVLPTVGVVLASGVAAILAGLVYLPLGAIAILPGRLLLKVYEGLCVLAGKLPFCTWIGGRPEIWQMAVYGGLLGLAVFFMVLAGKASGKKKAAAGTVGKGCGNIMRICAVLAVLAGVCIMMPGFRREEKLRLTFLDVGQGDSVLAETEEGARFLIDGGSQNKSALAQYQLLPFLKSRGISYLDGIFVSHTDEDHISGIRELLSYMGEGLTTLRARMLVLPDWREPPEGYKELCCLAEKAGVPVKKVSEGDAFRSGDTILEVHWPLRGSPGKDVNEEGMVLELVSGEFRALFTGDIGEDTEEKLLDEGLLQDVDVLKVGHHGSRFSTGHRLLEVIQPEAAVISASDSNTYGHPAHETLDRLEKAGVRIWCTKDSGAVTLTVEEGGILAEGFVKDSGNPSGQRQKPVV